MNVLIVDDEPAYRRELRCVLEEAGHDVDCLAALAGSDLDRLCRDHDLLVVDVMLRESVGGLVLAEHLRDHHPEKPMIVISGFPFDDPSFATGMGARAFLAKPFGGSDLLRAIEAVASRVEG